VTLLGISRVNLLAEVPQVLPRSDVGKKGSFWTRLWEAKYAKNPLEMRLPEGSSVRGITLWTYVLICQEKTRP